MAKINVNREVTDVFYRYKMPAIIAKVEGRGNGVRTVLPNLPEIAKCLERSTIYTLKFFGHEVGTQTQVEKHTPQEIRYIINGVHTKEKLQDILYHFINRFVLCSECANPETKIDVKNERVMLNCKACGNIAQVVTGSKSEAKMEGYIVRNPPDEPGVSKKSGKKGKKGRDQKRKSPTDEHNGVFHENGQAGLNASESSEDDDWTDNVTTISEKMKSATVSVNALVQDEAVMQKSGQDRTSAFLKKAKDIYDKKGIMGLKSSIVMLKSEAVKLDLDNRAAPILAEVIFTKAIVDEIPKAAPILIHFTYSNAKSQKHLLGVMEALVKEHRSYLLKRVPHILKAFYDSDLVEEEIILEWDANPSKKYIPDMELQVDMRKAAIIFTTWLREAENDSESDGADGETDEVKVEFSAQGATSVDDTAVSDAVENGEVVDDDFIDNI